MTKFKWHLLLTPEVSTEQSQGIISCETCSIWQVTPLTSQVLSSLCVLDKVWSHTKMSSGCHWFLPICKCSSHFQKIQTALYLLAVQMMSSRACRCSEQSQPQRAVSEGQGCAFPPCRSSSAQQCIHRLLRQLPALITTRITGGRQESHLSSLGVPCAMLRLRRNVPLV